MSFGWSVGDVIAAIQLTTKVITSLSDANGSRTHFQELESELNGLQTALLDISDLTSCPEQIPEITALKFASCACGETIQRFYEKIKPFEEDLGVASKIRKLKAAPRMVRWELLMRKDVPELQTYLAARAGSLNFRLSTALLKAAATSRSQNKSDHVNAREFQIAQFESINVQVLKIEDQVISIRQRDTIPTLATLLYMTTSIWHSNNKLIDMLSALTERAPPPNPRYAWFQAPVLLEDAIDRHVTIPSEYDWEKLEAIIQVQFRTGPGSAKVKSGDYELFDASNFGVAISPSQGLIPGMRITMVIVVGRYGDYRRRCPLILCPGDLEAMSTSVMKCLHCDRRYRITDKKLLHPVRLADAARHKLSYDFMITREELNRYKNLSICFMAWPNISIQDINLRIIVHSSEATKLQLLARLSQAGDPGRSLHTSVTPKPLELMDNAASQQRSFYSNTGTIESSSIYFIRSSAPMIGSSRTERIFYAGCANRDSLPITVQYTMR